MTDITTITDDNLSLAWSKAFLHAMKTSSENSPPMLISITGFKDNEPIEDRQIRELLEKEFETQNKNVKKNGKGKKIHGISETASTIFPYNCWKRRINQPRADFYEWYTNDFLKRIKKRDPRNHYGTYFERMIAFECATNGEVTSINQLEHIIRFCNKSARRPRPTALQISCIDPAKDHTYQTMRGFPCLQQIGFTYDKKKELTVHAFYPVQYLFERGYGNYLGLCHLGEFLAHELKLKLVRLNVYVGKPSRGELNKTNLRKLESNLQRELNKKCID